MTDEQGRDIFFMKQALAEAKSAYSRGEVPIGAVVVAGGAIIARAHNLTETLCDATAHAEMQALSAAEAWLGAKYLKGCTLYVTVEPCPMCAAASFWCQIDRIVYGSSDPKRGYSTISPMLIHPKTQITKGVMENESEELMTLFFKSLRH